MSLPTYGSTATLKARAENGASSAVCRVTSSPAGLDARDGGDVDGRRQEVDDGVHERLHALVLEGGAAHHRSDADVERGLADDLAHVLGGDLLTVEVGLEEVVVVVGDRLDELEPVLVRQFLVIVRDVGDLEVRPELVEVDDGVHLDEVDDAAELGLAADGHLQRDGVGPRRSTIISRPRKKSAPMRSILLTKRDARDAVLVGLPPHGLRLRLDAADGAEQRDGAVEHAQAPLDLDGEVHVPGRVDDVDLRVAPGDGGGGRGDGDAALLLLRHPVHDGGALVDLADLVRLPGVVQDALGRRGLAGVDVRHDPDVARVV